MSVEQKHPEDFFGTDPENPEWTEEDFARARPGHELPSEILRAFPRTPRGPQRAPTKQLVSIRLSAEVLAAFRATGRGWQGRIDAALKAHLGL